MTFAYDSVKIESEKEFTIIRHTVNIAARLCGVAKKSQILFTETTMNMGKSFKEKRKFPRLDSSLLLHYQVYNTTEIVKDIFLTKDISEGGLSFSCPEDFKVETILELEILLPTKDISLKTLGKVVWSQEIEPSKYDIGLSFVKINEEDRKALFSYLSLFGREKKYQSFRSKFWERMGIVLIIGLLVTIYFIETNIFPGTAASINQFIVTVILVSLGMTWWQQRKFQRQLKKTSEKLGDTERDLRKSYLNTIKTLALTLESRDPYTKGHSTRVTEYALAVAEQLEFSEDEKEVIRNAGILHDIGKISISDSILQKPAKLTEDEYAIVKKHPDIGVSIIKLLSFLKKERKIILEHHERVDGKGYHGMILDKIPFISRILAVTDSFDAMTSDRPYRSALTVEEALEELKRNKGTQFDPEIVDIFVKVIEKDNDFSKS